MSCNDVVVTSRFVPIFLKIFNLLFCKRKIMPIRGLRETGKGLCRGRCGQFLTKIVRIGQISEQLIAVDVKAKMRGLVFQYRCKVLTETETSCIFRLSDGR